MTVRYQEAFEESRSAALGGEHAVEFLESVARWFTGQAATGGGQGRRTD